MGKLQAKPLLTTADILSQLTEIASERQEHYVVLTLDMNLRLIQKKIVFIGTVTSVIANPREVYAVAVADLATAIIVAHNHPSGDPTPSSWDIKATRQLEAAGMILGIELYDHIVVANNGHFSFRKYNLLTVPAINPTSDRPVSRS